MIIDVLNKVLMINVCQMEVFDSQAKPFYLACFEDVTAQTSAKLNPTSGVVQLGKIPLYEKGRLLFLESRSIFYFGADGNYCQVFSESGRHYLHASLKQVLHRYVGPEFVRTHKSCVVNLRRVRGIKRQQGQHMVVFDNDQIPPAPVARRRLADLKKALGLP